MDYPNTKRIPVFYLELREIFPENIKDIFKRWHGTLLNKIFSVLESWVIRKATKINLISPGFLEYYQAIHPMRQFSSYTHAVDPRFINENNSSVSLKTTSERIKVVYAGNVGYGQQLHLILPELAHQTAHTLDFYIMGEGNNLVLLQNALKIKKIHNVTLLPKMPRQELIYFYQSADILFLHIYPYPFSLRVIPSKVFEYAATGKPIWAGVKGYAKQFMETKITNCAVFNPCDANDALLALPTLKLQTQQRKEFVNEFNQDRLMSLLAKEILSP